MDCLDADALIYAASRDHPLGVRVAALFGNDDDPHADRIAGSVLLLPEVLARPVRDGRDEEIDALAFLLARMALVPVDRMVAEVAVVMAAKYRLRAPDAIHLATAVNLGADRFVTNNRRDLDAAAVSEVAVVYPADLPTPT